MARARRRIPVVSKVLQIGAFCVQRSPISIFESIGTRISAEEALKRAHARLDLTLNPLFVRQGAEKYDFREEVRSNEV